MIQKSHFWAYIQKRQKLLIWKDIRTPKVYSSTIHKSQDTEAT